MMLLIGAFITVPTPPKSFTQSLFRLFFYDLFSLFRFQPLYGPIFVPVPFASCYMLPVVVGCKPYDAKARLPNCLAGYLERPPHPTPPSHGSVVQVHVAVLRVLNCVAARDLNLSHWQPGLLPVHLVLLL
jgi:hypothetical protein